MSTFTINLPDTFEVASRGKSVEVNIGSMPQEIIENAVLYGLKQKIADAASGAAASAAIAHLGNKKEGESQARYKKAISEWTMDKSNWSLIQVEAQRMMAAMAERLAAGEWGVQRTGGGAVDPVTKKARQMAATILKKKLVEKYGDAKRYTGLVTAEQHKACDAVLASNPEIVEQARELLEQTKAAKIDLSALDL